MFILDMLRVMGLVLLQAHSWLWLPQPCKAALPKELGWESMVLLLPSVVIPRGAAGGVESPLWEQGRDWGPE